jgi:NAD(P)-dependent dehydrogenase (short-subunit alcohol dehydrogenase family)
VGKLGGKVAVITGAGSGIGSGIARAFAREGARLVLAGRTAATLEETARALGGAEAVAVSCDVTDERQVAELFAAAVRAFGRVDIAVNNAGVFDGGPVEELSLETWQHVLAVNLTGPFLCTREAMRLMKPQGGGRILNVGSISAQVPRMHSVPYSTTKHGLVGLTRAAALEGREHGVVVSCIHPGNVLTERRQASDAPADQEPMMTPDELAEVALAMVSLPLHVNVLESIVLPTEQLYIGRG